MARNMAVQKNATLVTIVVAVGDMAMRALEEVPSHRVQNSQFLWKHVRGTGPENSVREAPHLYVPSYPAFDHC